MKSYKGLEIYRLSRKVAVKIRLESAKLPSIDRFEVGSQITRSSQSIKDKY
jgi:hypothetical protein